MCDIHPSTGICNYTDQLLTETVAGTYSKDNLKPMIQLPQHNIYTAIKP